MAAKAVAITNANIGELKRRFEIEDVTEPLAVGYFLVADFGSLERVYDVVTKEVLLEKFHIPGVRLQNNFFEVQRKDQDHG